MFKTNFSPSVWFCVVWLLLPNLLFFAFWIYGGPARVGFILLYYGLGILGTLIPLRVVIPLYIILVLCDVVMMISLVFNIPIASMHKNVDELASMNLIPYLGVAAAIVANAFVVIRLMMLRRPQWLKLSFIPVTLAVLILATTDAYLQTIGGYGFGRYLAPGTSFNSAVSASGFASDSANRNTDLLLVVVESWGVLKNFKLAASAVDQLTDTQVLRNFEISEGQIPFYGHTTDGEIRELCGHWGDYHKYLGETSTECLPARLQQQGYSTHAYHGFYATYFERHLWYPNIGLKNLNFVEQLGKEGRRSCHSVFVGICDIDVAADVKAQLQRSPQGKSFTYWLTLDSHLPAGTQDPAMVSRCESESLVGDIEVCKLHASWSLVFKEIASLAMIERERPLDILIVGDHVPPFWRRSARKLFHVDVVPWIYLKSRL